MQAEMYQTNHLPQECSPPNVITTGHLDELLHPSHMRLNMGQTAPFPRPIAGLAGATHFRSGHETANVEAQQLRD